MNGKNDPEPLKMDQV